MDGFLKSLTYEQIKTLKAQVDYEFEIKKLLDMAEIIKGFSHLNTKRKIKSQLRKENAAWDNAKTQKQAAFFERRVNAIERLLEIKNV